MEIVNSCILDFHQTIEMFFAMAVFLLLIGQFISFVIHYREEFLSEDEDNLIELYRLQSFRIRKLMLKYLKEADFKKNNVIIPENIKVEDIKTK